MMAEETPFIVSNTKMVKAALTDTTSIYVQANVVRGEEDIASREAHAATHQPNASD